MTKVIQQITGLRINHFVGIDFNGFKEMVDAVHGVTIHLDKPIDDVAGRNSNQDTRWQFDVIGKF